jgi:hypothetical protein
MTLSGRKRRFVALADRRENLIGIDALLADVVAAGGAALVQRADARAAHEPGPNRLVAFGEAGPREREAETEQSTQPAVDLASFFGRSFRLASSRKYQSEAHSRGFVLVNVCIAGELKKQNSFDFLNSSDAQAVNVHVHTSELRSVFLRRTRRLSQRRNGGKNSMLNPW